jgi:hypothetical protein
MIDWQVGVGLCLTGLLAVSALPATAQQFNSQQTTLLEQTAADVCNTVKQAIGKKSDIQIRGDVGAELSGIAGKFVNAGASGGVSTNREKFEGLSQDATATALEGDRGCRERVFLRMFDKLTAGALRPPAEAPPASKDLICRVTDPTGTPLNVRATPNGVIENQLYNNYQVKPLRFATAANEKTWAYVSNTAGQGIGWVFFPYLTCQ